VGERPPASLEEATNRSERERTAGLLDSISGNTPDNTQIVWAAPDNTCGNLRQKSGAISLDDFWKAAGNSASGSAARGTHPSHVEMAGAGKFIPGCFQLEGQEMRHIQSTPTPLSVDNLAKTMWHGKAYADKGDNTTRRPTPLNPTAAEFTPNEVGVSSQPLVVDGTPEITTARGQYRNTHSGACGEHCGAANPAAKEDGVWSPNLTATPG
jgi:hypothetical protein